jgi:hypothetical protein
MALYNFHRVLIAASILFDVLFSFWCWGIYQKTDQSVYIVMLVGSTLLTVGLIAYLIHFNRKTRRLRRALEHANLHADPS